MKVSPESPPTQISQGHLSAKSNFNQEDKQSPALPVLASSLETARINHLRVVTSQGAPPAWFRPDEDERSERFRPRQDGWWEVISLREGDLAIPIQKAS
jgi:hypothetical protein